MATFRYDPEAGDVITCPFCDASGIVRKVLRGRIYITWKLSGQTSREEDIPWSRVALCGYCGVEAREVRPGRDR